MLQRRYLLPVLGGTAAMLLPPATLAEIPASLRDLDLVTRIDRVVPGRCLPGAPTDPDVRDCRNRLVGTAKGFPCFAAEPTLNVAVAEERDELDAEPAAGGAQRPADAASELMATLNARAMHGALTAILRATPWALIGELVRSVPVRSGGASRRR